MLVLRLRADQPKPVQVLVDGEYLQTVQVTTAWRDYTLSLTRPAGAQAVIELQTPPTVASVDEPYARGVAVALISLSVK